jgi:hypothetical protein
MTGSILLNIYDDLEAMTVTYVNKSGGNSTPSVANLDEIPASVATADLPIRILLPIGQGAGGTNNAEILRGAGVKASWTITDLFLLDTAARELGPYIQAPVLLRYVAAYAEALGKQFQFLEGDSTLSLTINASIVPGMYEYPAGGGTWFYGCKSDITIEEIF